MLGRFAALQAPFDGCAEHVQRERLAQVFAHVQADRVDHRPCSRSARDQHRREIGLLLAHVLEQADPTLVGEVDTGNRQLKRLLRKVLARLRGARRRANRVSLSRSDRYRAHRSSALGSSSTTRTRCLISSSHMVPLQLGALVHFEALRV